MNDDNSALPEPSAEDRARARFFTASSGKPPTDEQRAAVRVSGPQRFRKLPVEIEAMRWDGTAEGAAPVIDWILSSWPHAAWYVGADEPHRLRTKDEHAAPGFLVIDTLEGPHRADAGDVIIRGVAGEFYPCKPDIFEQTYELVEPVIEAQTYTSEQRRYFPVSMRDRLDEGTP